MKKKQCEELEYVNLRRKSGTLTTRVADLWLKKVFKTGLPKPKVVTNARTALRVLRGQGVDVTFDRELKNNPSCGLVIIEAVDAPALGNNGNRWFGKGKARYNERKAAIKATMRLWDRSQLISSRVVLVAPLGPLLKLLEPAQFIHPNDFGEARRKNTGLVIKGNLHPLAPTDRVEPDPKPEGEATYEGLYLAMVNQWRLT